MNYKKWFVTDNKSGWKTKANYLKKRAPEIYDQLTSFISLHNHLEQLSFKQQIWHFINNDPVIPKCLNCGKEVTMKKSLTKGYPAFCSLECANLSDIIQERAVSALKSRYGVSAFSKHESFINKAKETKLKKYGDVNYNNIQKAIETKKRLYGSSNNKNKAIITLRQNFLKRLEKKTSDKIVGYDANATHITLNCSACKRDYEIYNNMINYRLNNNIKPCTLCNPIGSSDSFHEKELIQFIKEVLADDEIIEYDRNVISPYELDILIPKKNLAIEFNGIYWHSDLFVEDSYHLKKSKSCLDKGIELIHIFEDEWIYKKDIVKSILLSKLGLNTSKIAARKTKIREVSTLDTRNFLNKNHIQGNVYGKINLGLYYNDELVSLMNFGNLRKNLGNTQKENNYELLRFCNKLNTSVVGAFSKLISHFIRNFHPISILTYSDNRYFNGDVYRKSGFNFISESKPNYFYVVNHKRENRFKYRKDILVKGGFDSSKSEREIMKEIGVPRIYDSGCKKWILNFKN